MSKNRDLITALIAAEKHFAKNEYTEGLTKQAEALALLGVNPSQKLIELVAIHCCRAGYLAMTTPDISEEKIALIKGNPDLLQAQGAEFVRNMIAQLEKGYAWIQKLNLEALDRPTRIFLAQSRLAEASIKVLKFSFKTSDGSKVTINTGRSLKDAIVCMDQAKAIMRSTPAQDRKEEDSLYIKSYSLLKKFAMEKPSQYGFEDIEPEDYSESSLSETETENLIRPYKEREEQQSSPSLGTCTLELGESLHIHINEKTHIKQNVQVNNSIQINAEAETSEKLFADKAKALLHFQPEKLVGTMFHSREASQPSELTHNLSYKITRSYQTE